MNWPWDNIKLVSGLIGVFGLFAFANSRNAARQLIVNESIEFENNTALLISHQAVNKLLIQKNKHVRNLKKDALDLKELENILDENPMIKKAQVYLTVNGELGVNIKQRKPIARVLAIGSLYIDDEGKMMPLSENFSARVILVTGNVTEKTFPIINELVTYINADDFLKKHFVSVQVEDHNELYLQTRSQDYKVHLGSVLDLEKKFRNYKAFYAKAIKDQIVTQYSLVNLEFKNQVVCTKKTTR